MSVSLCRPANTPTAIHPSLQIGIPAFISDRDDLFQLYFVTLAPVPQILTAPGKLQVALLLDCVMSCCLLHWCLSASVIVC